MMKSSLITSSPMPVWATLTATMTTRKVMTMATAVAITAAEVTAVLGTQVVRFLSAA